jgi:hypothetical protein
MRNQVVLVLSSMQPDEKRAARGQIEFSDNLLGEETFAATQSVPRFSFIEKGKESWARVKRHSIGCPLGTRSGVTSIHRRD